MSRNVRELGVQKVDNIIQKIGYPVRNPDIRDSAVLRDYYSSLNITSSSYFENTLSTAIWGTKREWSALGKPTDRDEWGMTAATVNVRKLLEWPRDIIMLRTHTTVEIGVLQSGIERDCVPCWNHANAGIL